MNPRCQFICSNWSPPQGNFWLVETPTCWDLWLVQIQIAGSWIICKLMCFRILTLSMHFFSVCMQDEEWTQRFRWLCETKRESKSKQLKTWQVPSNFCSSQKETFFDKIILLVCPKCSGSAVTPENTDLCSGWCLMFGKLVKLHEDQNLCADWWTSCCFVLHFFLRP